MNDTDHPFKRGDPFAPRKTRRWRTIPKHKRQEIGEPLLKRAAEASRESQRLAKESRRMALKARMHRTAATIALMPNFEPRRGEYSTLGVRAVARLFLLGREVNDEPRPTIGDYVAHMQKILPELTCEDLFKHTSDYLRPCKFTMFDCDVAVIEDALGPCPEHKELCHDH